jgi:nicotinate-nucleotide pyrophosphorylase (carboxylating)
LIGLDIKAVKNILDASFQEDYGIAGDVTSEAIVPPSQMASFSIIPREDVIISGLTVAEYFFREYSAVEIRSDFLDSDLATKNSVILSGYGSAREILRLERIILNYLQHMSGIATATKAYVDQVDGTRARICDTRKTLPGLRALQKYAVRCGGGFNHRLALDSGILIKDNHLVIAGSVENAITQARASGAHYNKIEIECDSLEQVQRALEHEADIIMLDNMNLEQIRTAIGLIKRRALVEVSGNVTLRNVREIAETGVDVISVGRLTHSVKAVDLSLELNS